MAGKTYIKTGTNTWSRVKKIYLKTGGITWQAVRKAYIKTGATTWKKVYDTTSNRPFIGNDIPKIRLNTFRTDSTAGSLIPILCFRHIKLNKHLFNWKSRYVNKFIRLFGIRRRRLL